MRVKTDREVQTLIENMAQNEYRTDADKKKMEVFGVSDNTTILENQAAMNKQLEALTKYVQGLSMGNQAQQVAAIRCDFCGGGNVNCECVPEGASEEANYMGNY